MKTISALWNSCRIFCWATKWWRVSFILLIVLGELWHFQSVDLKYIFTLLFTVTRLLKLFTRDKLKIQPNIRKVWKCNTSWLVALFLITNIKDEKGFWFWLSCASQFSFIFFFLFFFFSFFFFFLFNPLKRTSKSFQMEQELGVEKNMVRKRGQRTFDAGPEHVLFIWWNLCFYVSMKQYSMRESNPWKCCLLHLYCSTILYVV